MRHLRSRPNGPLSSEQIFLIQDHLSHHTIPRIRREARRPETPIVTILTNVFQWGTIDAACLGPRMETPSRSEFATGARQYEKFGAEFGS